MPTLEVQKTCLMGGENRQQTQKKVAHFWLAAFEKRCFLQENKESFDSRVSNLSQVGIDAK